MMQMQKMHNFADVSGAKGAEIAVFDFIQAEVSLYVSGNHAGTRAAALAGVSLRRKGWRYSQCLGRWVMCKGARTSYV